MSQRGGVYRFMSTVMAISMLLQLLVPVVSLPGATAVHAATQTNQPETVNQTSMMAATAVTQPDILANPISVSRVQSSYQAGSSLVITYTVSNNRPPTILPDVAANATITETMDAVADFDYSQDPNTIRNVLLTTALTTEAAFASATLFADSRGDSLAWNMGAIPPLGSKTAILTVTPPFTVADFTDLNDGAVVWGTLQGRAVTAVANPATIAPDNFSQWLIWTVDANIYDEEMLAKAAQIGQEPTRLFEYVRGLGYESYTGSLRGTRGTLWSEAGNAVDQASLLIAMLRASGIPARYRHGSISTADAQTLISSMFPDPTRIIGHVPDHLETSDPVNDPDLLAETTDHWWVEAYLPGQGWVNMDPTFANAAIGDNFAAAIASDGSDRIAELPDDLRHKVTLQLKVEDYYILNLGGGGLNETYPFSQTFNLVELTGEPVAFSHIVETESQGGMVFANVIHTYTPYLLIGDREFFGEAYQDIFTTFPLGTIFHTGAWLEFTLTDPAGNTDRYERELKDLIGYDNRINGGDVDLTFTGDNSPLFTSLDIFATGFWPNLVPETAVEKAQAASLGAIEQISTDGQRLAELRNQTTFTPEESEEFSAIRYRYQLNMSRYLSALSLSFAQLSDELLAELEEGGLVKGYHDSARLVTVASEIVNGNTGIFTMDLRRTAARAIPYPGQDVNAGIGFNIAKGIVESGLEGAVLEESVGTAPVTTARLFSAAREQDIATLAIDASNLATLDGLAISEKGKARIAAAVLEGKFLFIPEVPVMLDGESHTGWWEVTPTTGETIGVLDDGSHGAVQYLFTVAFMVVSGPLVDFMLGFTSSTFGFVASHVDKAIGPGTFDRENYDTQIGAVSTMLTCVGALAFPQPYAMFSCFAGGAGGQLGAPMDFFGLGQMFGNQLLNSRVQGDPPLSDAWLSYRVPDNRQAEVSGEVTAMAVYPAGNLSVNADTEFAVITGTTQADWTSPGSVTYPFTNLSISNGTLYDENDALIGSGAISAVPLENETTLAAASASTASLNGTGRASFYAPTLDGLGNGSQWQDYAGQLSSGSSYTLKLADAAVTLNGTTYNGDLSVETTTVTSLAGSGPGAAANFAATADFQATNAQIIIGPAAGTITANGTPVDAANGLAVAGYDDTVTVSDGGGTSDHIDMSGVADFYTLNLSPASSTTDPVTAVSFQTEIAANYSGTYAVTVAAPDGWHVVLDGSGLVTATPPDGAAAGDYAILVTAHSLDYSELYLSASHTVTISTYDGFKLSVQPDSVFTVPMGEIRNPYDLAPKDTNTGQAQVPGAAYTINITNTANVPRTYDVSVSGLPAGWALLSTAPNATQTTLDLPAGGAGQIGLYITPDTLPAPGANYDFTVTAVSDSGPSDSDTGTFTMPAVPFSMVLPNPVVIYASPNSTTTLDLSLTNVGNASGSFPLTAHVLTDTVTPQSSLQSPIALNADETHTQSVILDVGNAPVGQTFPIFFDSPIAGTVYTQTTASFVQIVSPESAALFAAATCSLGSDSLAASWQTVGLDAADLLASCASGDCSLTLRDRVVTDIENVHTYLNAATNQTTAAGDLLLIAADLSGHTTSVDIEADMTALIDVAEQLGGELCELEEHLPSAKFSPNVDAILLGDSANFTLDVTNEGRIETSYAITVTGLPSGDLFFNETIAAGTTTSLPLTPAPATLGVFNLEATAVPTGPDVQMVMSDTAVARLNVVDKFVQVTQVRANPDFVETGISATDLSVEIANVSGVAQPGNARTAVLAPDGSTIWTQDIPLTALAGNPRFYNLTTVNTSGWAEGTYTVTVDFLDDVGTLIPDGSGYGYFNVGQALIASQAVVPEIVAPGNVTVTTVITTEIITPDLFTGPLAFPNATPGEVVPFTEPLSDTDVLPARQFDPSPALEEEVASTTAVLPSPAASFSVPGYTHYEENDAALLYNGDTITNTLGAWTTASQTIASDGQTAYSGTLSDTVSLTFTGTAVFLGFHTRNWGGLAQVSIDGIEQEIVDTYSNEPDSLTRRYPDLGAGTHTITVTVLDQRNPFALRDNIYLDFIDVWEGSPLADGTFEAETAVRVFSSGDWNILSDAGASAGQYLERGSTVWFPFTGDSVSLVLPSDRFSDDMRLFVDDQFIEFFDNYSPTFITETISLEGLGAGAHLLRLEAYRGRGLADAFATPGAAPFWQPPDKSGYFRYEEDDPDLRYNGVPFFQTAGTWNRSSGTRSSDGQQVRTTTAGDTAALTFTGEWVSLGFLGDAFSGEIEVLLDGVSQGIFDLYRHDTDPVSFQFGNLGAGVHTITAVNLGTTHPNSGGTRMWLDYIDTWDGTPLPQGKIEAEDSTRTYYSSDVGVVNQPDASGGAYVRDGILRQGNLWFPFTGDSITLQTWSGDLNMMRLKIDGVEQPPLDLFNTTAQTRTVNFEGLGAGVHVLELNRYRSDFNADAFIVPAITATFPYPPVPQTGIVRYEEDHPDVRYNGTVYSQTVGSWNYNAGSNISSNFVVQTGQTGNSLTLDFDGSWFGVGFDSTVNTGVADIFLDGQLLDSVDTSGDLGPMSRYYDVITGTHTISVTAVNPIRVDFIDVWDGTPMPDGWYDADLNDRIAKFHYSTSWTTHSNEYAREENMVGRGLVNTRRTMWFGFTGSDLTFRSYNDNNGQYEIFIDGFSQGVYTTTAVYSNQPINWHFPDLDNGPHVFSLKALDGASRTYVDAFYVNPEKFVDAAPSIEWFDFTAGVGGGFLSTMAAGDINNDGVVEIIAPANDGNLYVYRGDGQDAGGGSPLIWSAATGVSNEPSIADIDLDGYGEVLLLAENGLFAFEHDGTTKWVDSAIFSSINSNYGWGGVAVGNLDLDDEPELVVAPSQQQAAVVSADGAAVTRFGPTFGDFPTAPILADVNGDGLLDIIVAGDDTIYVYDYFNSLNLIWSYTYDTSDITANTGSQTWGAPAVANLDADDDPEIIIFFEEKVVALNHDGTELWVYKDDNSNGYRPSHVTVADVDGDSEVEIIVAQGLSAGLIVLSHEILVLNADGTLLWSEIVAETTSSSSGVATHDFNGDGVWEVLWNGFGDGFLIFNGPDGDRIFNEPRINSGTIVDYPSVADVDGDNFAEVLLGDGEGLWVVGHDDVWADSRPLWSGNSYRITDINDDLSVPVNEQPSWLVHNTYRTQTPNRTPAPAYQVALTYTEGIDNVTVLTDTASIPLTAVPPTYTWSYHQEWYQRVMTTTFDSLLTDMQPGEVRQVSQGTQIAYELPSGVNHLTLPPMYASAPRIVTMSPGEVTAATGSTAVYDITLFNPDTSGGDTYTLSLAGIPNAWASYPALVNLAAGAEQTVQLNVAIPADAVLDTLPVIVDVANAASGTDQAMALLTIVKGVDLTITPDMQTAVPHQPVTYTLTITNYESIQHTYTLTATGLADVTLPPTVVVGPGDVVTIEIIVSSEYPGPQPFTIVAVGDNDAEDRVDAILDVPNLSAVSLALAPDPAVSGPGSTAVLTATITNLGGLADSFDLSVTVPTGWSYEWPQSETAVKQVNLPPNLFNSTELMLLVTPDVGAALGDYPVVVTAVSQTDPDITAIVTGTVQVSNRGVQVEILSGPTTLDPRDVGVWDVRLTNTGSVADTFDLQAAGLIALAGTFSTDAVTLNPGQSQTVQLTADNLDFILPQTYPVVVAATAQGDAYIQHQDSRDVTFSTYEAIGTVWRPNTQTITDTLTAGFTLVMTNTGNIATTYQVSTNASGASTSTAVQQIVIPAHGVAAVLVTVDVPNVGTYQVEAAVTSLSSGVSAWDTAVLTVNTVNDPYPIKVMLPVVMK